MEMNAIQSPATTCSTSPATCTSKASPQTGKAGASNDPKDSTGKETSPAAVYEKTDPAAAAAPKVYKPDTEKIKQMQDDMTTRQQTFLNLIRQMFGKQAKTLSLTDDALWKTLAAGDFTVDEKTKEQALKDISEDGYWGVKQTSGRILDFAKALTGGDPSKIEKMRSAFEQGYKQAEKTWGGHLPEICKKTYDAVMKGFDDWKKECTTPKEDAAAKNVTTKNTTPKGAQGEGTPSGNPS